MQVERNLKLEVLILVGIAGRCRKSGCIKFRSLIYKLELRFEGGFRIEADEFFDRFAVFIVDH